MNLFIPGPFTSASGLTLADKIECDAITNEDWDAIAAWFAPRIAPFSHVVGAPTGGRPLAAAMDKYAFTTSSISPPILLICDDVITTGRSMSRWRNKFADFDNSCIIGIALFSRLKLVPDWIKVRFIEQ